MLVGDAEPLEHAWNRPLARVEGVLGGSRRLSPRSRQRLRSVSGNGVGWVSRLRISDAWAFFSGGTCPSAIACGADFFFRRRTEELGCRARLRDCRYLKRPTCADPALVLAMQCACARGGVDWRCPRRLGVSVAASSDRLASSCDRPAEEWTSLCRAGVLFVAGRSSGWRLGFLQGDVGKEAFRLRAAHGAFSPLLRESPNARCVGWMDIVRHFLPLFECSSVEWLVGGRRLCVKGVAFAGRKVQRWRCCVSHGWRTHVAGAFGNAPHRAFHWLICRSVAVESLLAAFAAVSSLSSFSPFFSLLRAPCLCWRPFFRWHVC